MTESVTGCVSCRLDAECVRFDTVSGCWMLSGRVSSVAKSVSKLQHFARKWSYRDQLARRFDVFSRKLMTDTMCHTSLSRYDRVCYLFSFQIINDPLSRVDPGARTFEFFTQGSGHPTFCIVYKNMCTSRKIKILEIFTCTSGPRKKLSCEYKFILLRRRKLFMLGKIFAYDMLS